MNSRNKLFLAPTIIAILFLSICVRPVAVHAWGDNSEGGKGRPSYTTEEIDNGALGATLQSDGENYKDSDNYPGQIIFNTISDGDIGDEKNFVGARQTELLENGRAVSATPDTKWQGNNITVEDGKYYVIRLYVHNNNPNGEDAVAENTRVKFSIPNGTSKQIQVNGFISSSNATPSEYWDYVNFNSETPFHLDYVYGSALLSNSKAKDEAVAGGYLDSAGWKLNDDIVKAASTDGVLIGSDALDGKVPGGRDYAGYVTILVKAIFDYDFTVEQKVRLAGGNKEDWADTVDAEIGDKVEFRILYTNTSSEEQQNVAIKDILPANLKYVEGSSIIKNTSYPDGAYILNDSLVENGIRIGNYDANGGNALVYFTAEVVDENLDQGLNVLTNWSQAGVGDKTIQDSAEVRVQNDAKYIRTITIYIVVICICFIISIITICKTIKRHKATQRK